MRADPTTRHVIIPHGAPEGYWPVPGIAATPF